MAWFKWMGPLVALFVIAGFVSAAESTDVKELLERMKKMEAKMAEQDKTIKDLRAGNETKATASQQVDKALSNSSAGLIFHDPNIHKRPIKIGGYMDVTYQYGFNQPTVPVPSYNMERVFDNMDNNTFDLHLAKIFFDATAQEKGQAGFRLDLAYGRDADLIEHQGADTNDNFTIEQAYIDYIIPVGNGLRMKVGKFVTPVGYEVIEAQDNWNATRSFNFGKGIPFTHTGVGFEYQVFSNWNVAGYFVNGWDNLIDNNEGKTGIVQSKWSPVKWMSWTVTGVVGNEGARSTNQFNNEDRADEDTTYLVNTVLTFSPWEKWDFAAEATYGLTENGSNNDADDGTPGGGPHIIAAPPAGSSYNTVPGHFRTTPDAKWWGAAGYFKYKFLPGWYLAGRGEYFKDDGATRTEYGQRFAGSEELYSGTVTMSYTPTAPFEIRLEYRYDASSRDVFVSKQYDAETLGGGVWAGAHGMDGNLRDRVNTQDTLTVQFLYKF